MTDIQEDIMDSRLSEGLKRVVYMGIGAAALTVEKTGEILDLLEAKGEQTVEQGKELNQELRRNVKKTFEESKEEAEEE